jgi:hypothetical protein
MSADIIQKIKSRGHWYVELRPLRYKKERIDSPPKCKEIVEKSNVSLRGWDYPYHGERLIRNGLNYVQSALEWNNHIEYWRMHQSGQFVHLLTLTEDEWAGIELGKFLEVQNTLYSITEFYEFASRLAEKGLFPDGLSIRIDLNKVLNRKLFIADPMRAPLVGEYSCGIDSLPYPKQFTQEEILGKAHELAIDHAVWIFEKFNWTATHLPSLLKEIQEKFLKGLL